MELLFTPPCAPTPHETDTKDRRQHLRYPCTGKVDVYRENRRVGAAIVENISETGIGFHMDTGVEPGTELRMRNGYVDFHVIVRHIERLPDGYFLGSEFSGGFRWSADQRWPGITPDQE